MHMTTTIALTFIHNTNCFTIGSRVSIMSWTIAQVWDINTLEDKCKVYYHPQKMEITF